MELVLNILTDLQTSTMIKLNNINANTKVEDFRNETARKINLSKDTIELVYCGCTLENEATLEYYGLKNGSVIQVLKKKETETSITTEPISEESILRLIAAYKSFNENATFRSALHRLSKRPEAIDNIISSSPALHKDSIAIAILLDPDLMGHFSDVDTVRRIAEFHPVLVEAAQNLAGAVHEEARNACQSASATGSSGGSNSQSTAYSYSLDNLSDDEEMAADSSQSSDSIRPTDSPSTITTAQLSAALARARARGVSTTSVTNSGSGNSMNNSANNSGIITPEMFTRAMQQAFGSEPPPVAPSSLPPVLPPFLPQFADLQTQLAQMHEMGLQDDAVNVQALQFTNGDVQAAVELVFSGFSDD